MPDDALDYGDHRGRIELRETLASYLGRVRGVRVDPSRMVITQGFSQSLDLLCRTLAARGATTIAVETPSLDLLWQTIASWGLRLVGVPMDATGLGWTSSTGSRPDAFVVSPAHQYPTGQVMAAGPAHRPRRVGAASLTGSSSRTTTTRRTATTACRSGRCRASIPSHVVHAGTTSKTLAPALRHRLAEPARRARRAAHRR